MQRIELIFSQKFSKFGYPGTVFGRYSQIQSNFLQIGHQDNVFWSIKIPLAVSQLLKKSKAQMN